MKMLSKTDVYECTMCSCSCVQGAAKSILSEYKFLKEPEFIPPIFHQKVWYKTGQKDKKHRTSADQKGKKHFSWENGLHKSQIRDHYKSVHIDIIGVSTLRLLTLGRTLIFYRYIAVYTYIHTPLRRSSSLTFNLGKPHHASAFEMSEIRALCLIFSFQLSYPTSSSASL